MEQADLIEYASESLQYNLEAWIFAGNKVSDDIKRFFEFCLKDNEESLHCKRAKDGKSFYERRQNAAVV